MRDRERKSTEIGKVVMATGEQMQELLQPQQQELQVLTARMAAMEAQLQYETARAHQAEQERSRLIEKMDQCESTVATP